MSTAAKGSAEGFEDGAREWAVAPAPLGVPLHAQNKARRSRHRDRFDLTIGCNRVGMKHRCERVDALAVKRSRCCGALAEDLAKRSAWLNMEVVCGAVLHIERGR